MIRDKDRYKYGIRRQHIKMSSQSGAYEHSYEDFNYPDQEFTNNLRCFK